MAKKELKCETCKYYDKINCTHESNIGIRIKNRTRTKIFVETPKTLEKTCKNYKENDV